MDAAKPWLGKDKAYYPSPKYDYEKPVNVANKPVAMAKESFWHKFFSFKGRLDQLGFMVRIYALTLLPMLVVSKTYNFIFTPQVLYTNEVMAGFGFFVILIIIAQVVLGASYVSLIFRRLNDSGTGKFWLLFPIAVILCDLCLTCLIYFAKDIAPEILANGISTETKTFASVYLFVYTLDGILKKAAIFFFLYLCVKKGIYGSTVHGDDIVLLNCLSHLNNEPTKTDNNLITETSNNLFKRFLSFKGRFSQYQFLLNLMILYIIYRVAGFIFNYIPNYPLVLALLKFLSFIVLFVSFLALCAKRLHDKNRSSLFCIFYIITAFCYFTITVEAFNNFIINYINIFGAVLIAGFCLSYILIFYLILCKGVKGHNKFGPDPLLFYCRRYCEKITETFS